MVRVPESVINQTGLNAASDFVHLGSLPVVIIHHFHVNVCMLVVMVSCLPACNQYQAMHLMDAQLGRYFDIYLFCFPVEEDCNELSEDSNRQGPSSEAPHPLADLETALTLTDKVRP